MDASIIVNFVSLVTLDRKASQLLRLYDLKYFMNRTLFMAR